MEPAYLTGLIPVGVAGMNFLVGACSVLMDHHCRQADSKGPWTSGNPSLKKTRTNVVDWCIQRFVDSVHTLIIQYSCAFFLAFVFLFTTWDNNMSTRDNNMLTFGGGFGAFGTPTKPIVAKVSHPQQCIWSKIYVTLLCIFSRSVGILLLWCFGLCQMSTGILRAGLPHRRATFCATRRKVTWEGSSCLG